MTPEEIAALQLKVNTATARIKALEPQEASLTALKSVVGDDLFADPEKLKQTIADGKAYRDETINEVVRLKRLKGLVGDDDAAVADAKSFYSTMPLSMLKKELEGLGKAMPEGGQLNADDPNNTGAGEESGEGKKGLRDSTKTKASIDAKTK